MASVTHQALLMVGTGAVAAVPLGWHQAFAIAAKPGANARRADATSYANDWLSNQWLSPGPGPLDGLSPTVAYSFSRKLLAAYGGPFYTTDTGAIDKVFDQSGNVRDATQITAGFRPLPTTAGPNSRACADFDGADDFMTGASALSNIISAGSGYVIVSVLVDAVAANQALIYQNNAIFADSGSFMGTFAKNVSGTTPRLFPYNWDGNADTTAGTSFALATVYVVTWRHEGGILYQSINGCTDAETSVTSGNTSDLTGFLRLGAAGAATFHNGRIFELAAFSTVPTADQRARLIQNFGYYVGASLVCERPFGWSQPLSIAARPASNARRADVNAFLNDWLSNWVSPPVVEVAPSALTGLIGWWDASVFASFNLTGANVNSIADQSGGGHTMTWAGFGKPTYSATGFNTTYPAFRVDAVHVGSSLESPTFPMGTGDTLTFWYVGKNDAANANTPGRALSYLGPAETDDFNNVKSWACNVNKLISNNTMTISRNAIVVTSINATVSNLTNHRLIGTIDSSGVERLYIDGVVSVLATSIGNWTTNGTMAIGRRASLAGNTYFAGDFAEVGVATGYTDAAHVAGLDLYLKNKWGL